MAKISDAKLKKSIVNILKDADLATTTTKKVIQALEKTYGPEIHSEKSKIDKMVLDYVNSMDTDEDEKEKESAPESESPVESASESEEEKPKPKRAAAKKGKKGVEKPAKKAAKGGGGKGKGTGFTRSYKLSPALSELMGADEMPRHAVVKRIWAIVKENNLYDPSNKQFAICDDALYKVIGKQRFRVFGMMKYLKTHFMLE